MYVQVFFNYIPIAQVHGITKGHQTLDQHARTVQSKGLATPDYVYTIKFNIDINKNYISVNSDVHSCCKWSD